MCNKERQKENWEFGDFLKIRKRKLLNCLVVYVEFNKRKCFFFLSKMERCWMLTYSFYFLSGSMLQKPLFNYTNGGRLMHPTFSSYGLHQLFLLHLQFYSCLLLLGKFCIWLFNFVISKKKSFVNPFYQIPWC